jgi:hypothetical protein
MSEMLDDRLSNLEDGFRLYRGRMDSVCKEMKILVAEINIITEFIHQNFGMFFFIFYYLLFVYCVAKISYV